MNKNCKRAYCTDTEDDMEGEDAGPILVQESRSLVLNVIRGLSEEEWNAIREQMPSSMTRHDLNDVCNSICLWVKEAVIEVVTPALFTTLHILLLDVPVTKDEYGVETLSLSTRGSHHSPSPSRSIASYMELEKGVPTAFSLHFTSVGTNQDQPLLAKKISSTTLPKVLLHSTGSSHNLLVCPEGYSSTEKVPFVLVQPTSSSDNKLSDVNGEIEASNKMLSKLCLALIRQTKEFLDADEFKTLLESTLPSTTAQVVSSVLDDILKMCAKGPNNFVIDSRLCKFLAAVSDRIQNYTLIVDILKTAEVDQKSIKQDDRSSFSSLPDETLMNTVREGTPGSRSGSSLLSEIPDTLGELHPGQCISSNQLSDIAGGAIEGIFDVVVHDLIGSESPSPQSLSSLNGSYTDVQKLMRPFSRLSGEAQPTSPDLFSRPSSLPSPFGSLDNESGVCAGVNSDEGKEPREAIFSPIEPGRFMGNVYLVAGKIQRVAQASLRDLFVMQQHLKAKESEGPKTRLERRNAIFNSSKDIICFILICIRDEFPGGDKLPTDKDYLNSLIHGLEAVVSKDMRHTLVNKTCGALNDSHTSQSHIPDNVKSMSKILYNTIAEAVTKQHTQLQTTDLSYHPSKSLEKRLSKDSLHLSSTELIQRAKTVIEGLRLPSDSTIRMSDGVSCIETAQQTTQTVTDDLREQIIMDFVETSVEDLCSRCLGLSDSLDEVQSSQSSTGVSNVECDTLRMSATSLITTAMVTEIMDSLPMIRKESMDSNNDSVSGVSCQSATQQNIPTLGEQRIECDRDASTAQPLPNKNELPVTDQESTPCLSLNCFSKKERKTGENKEPTLVDATSLPEIEATSSVSMEIKPIAPSLVSRVMDTVSLKIKKLSVAFQSGLHHDKKVTRLSESVVERLSVIEEVSITEECMASSESFDDMVEVVYQGLLVQTGSVTKLRQAVEQHSEDIPVAIASSLATLMNNTDPHPMTKTSSVDSIISQNDLSEPANNQMIDDQISKEEKATHTIDIKSDISVANTESRKWSILSNSCLPNKDIKDKDLKSNEGHWPKCISISLVRGLVKALLVRIARKNDKSTSQSKSELSENSLSLSNSVEVCLLEQGEHPIIEEPASDRESPEETVMSVGIEGISLRGPAVEPQQAVEEKSTEDTFPSEIEEQLLTNDLVVKKESMMELCNAVERQSQDNPDAVSPSVDSVIEDMDSTPFENTHSLEQAVEENKEETIATIARPLTIRHSVDPSVGYQKDLSGQYATPDNVQKSEDQQIECHSTNGEKISEEENNVFSKTLTKQETTADKVITGAHQDCESLKCDAKNSFLTRTALTRKSLAKMMNALFLKIHQLSTPSQCSDLDRRSASLTESVESCLLSETPDGSITEDSMAGVSFDDMVEVVYQGLLVKTGSVTKLRQAVEQHSEDIPVAIASSLASLMNNTDPQSATDAHSVDSSSISCHKDSQLKTEKYEIRSQLIGEDALEPPSTTKEPPLFVTEKESKPTEDTFPSEIEKQPLTSGLVVIKESVMEPCNAVEQHSPEIPDAITLLVDSVIQDMDSIPIENTHSREAPVTDHKEQIEMLTCLPLSFSPNNESKKTKDQVYSQMDEEHLNIDKRFTGSPTQSQTDLSDLEKHNSGEELSKDLVDDLNQDLLVKNGSTMVLCEAVKQEHHDVPITRTLSVASVVQDMDSKPLEKAHSIDVPVTGHEEQSNKLSCISLRCFQNNKSKPTEDNLPTEMVEEQLKIDQHSTGSRSQLQTDLIDIKIQNSGAEPSEEMIEALNWDLDVKRGSVIELCKEVEQQGILVAIDPRYVASVIQDMDSKQIEKTPSMEAHVSGHEGRIQKRPCLPLSCFPNNKSKKTEDEAHSQMDEEQLKINKHFTASYSQSQTDLSDMVKHNSGDELSKDLVDDVIQDLVKKESADIPIAAASSDASVIQDMDSIPLEKSHSMDTPVTGHKVPRRKLSWLPINCFLNKNNKKAEHSAPTKMVEEQLKIDHYSTGSRPLSPTDLSDVENHNSGAETYKSMVQAVNQDLVKKKSRMELCKAMEQQSQDIPITVASSVASVIQDMDPKPFEKTHSMDEPVTGNKEQRNKLSCLPITCFPKRKSRKTVDVPTEMVEEQLKIDQHSTGSHSQSQTDLSDIEKQHSVAEPSKEMVQDVKMDLDVTNGPAMEFIGAVEQQGVPVEIGSSDTSVIQDTDSKPLEKTLSMDEPVTGHKEQRRKLSCFPFNCFSNKKSTKTVDNVKTEMAEERLKIHQHSTGSRSQSHTDLSEMDKDNSGAEPSKDMTEAVNQDLVADTTVADHNGHYPILENGMECDSIERGSRSLRSLTRPTDCSGLGEEPSKCFCCPLKRMRKNKTHGSHEANTKTSSNSVASVHALMKSLLVKADKQSTGSPSQSKNSLTERSLHLSELVMTVLSENGLTVIEESKPGSEPSEEIVEAVYKDLLCKKGSAVELHQALEQHNEEIAGTVADSVARVLSFEDFTVVPSLYISSILFLSHKKIHSQSRKKLGILARISRACGIMKKNFLRSISQVGHNRVNPGNDPSSPVS